MSLTEFSLIERYFAASTGQRPDVVLGIGDDAALLQPPGDQHLVVTLDTLVAGVHFLEQAAPESIGHKALAVNLSDLAAMAAQPAWVTLALTLPAVDEAWLAQFCQGWFRLAARYGVQLVGGDTTHGPVRVITVQAHGLVPPGLALRREGAQPGDRVYVTGTLGDAGLALAAAQGQIPLAPADQAAVQQRLDWPQPRIAQGLALRGIASAAIDLSDGLAQDIGHILHRSRCGARLEVARLPLSPTLCAYPQRDAALTWALTSGDDYELCFTVPPTQEHRLRQAAACWDCGCTCIGVITPEPGLQLVRADGTQLPLTRLGYDHFG